MFCAQVLFARLQANQNLNQNEFSVIQLSNIVKTRKGAATFEVSQENFALPLLKQIRVIKNSKTLKFYILGAETCRSRFSKSFLPDGLNRPVSVDILNFQNWRTSLPIDFRRTAFQSRRARQSFSGLYVSKFESQKLSPKKLAPYRSS
jgi:hypothetical protein